MGLTASLILAVALATGAVSQKPPRSTCNRETQGRFWPEQANTDRKLARELTRSGELQICSRGFFRYNWEPISVNYQTLLQKKHAREAAPAGQQTASR